MCSKPALIGSAARAFLALPALQAKQAEEARGEHADGLTFIIGIYSLSRTQGILREHQRLVLVEEGMYFHQDAIARARQSLIEYIQKEGRLESVKFKYIVDTTRKFALPLLDYFDRSGLLRRVGNTRYLKVVPGPRSR